MKNEVLEMKNEEFGCATQTRRKEILHSSFFIPHLSLPLLHPDHRQLYAFPFGIYAEYLYAYLLVDGHNLIRV